jgi:hypothetical protein
MSKFIRTLAATAALLAGAAQAAVPSAFPFTGTIAANQTIDFSFITLAGGYATFNETILNGGLKAPALFELRDAGGPLVADSTTGFKSKTLNFNYLDAGAYTLRLTAGATGGAYSVASNVGLASQVPEPETLALALAGVGIAGTMLRRRNQA